MMDSPVSGPLLLRNIGTLVSGDIKKGVLPYDAILLEAGRISAVGYEADIKVPSDAQVIDVRRTTVCPGFIDSHVHLVLGDYTPRQKTVDFIASYVHGGITTLISASEVHAQGRPSDPVGVKSLAIAAQRCFSNYRPLGARIYGGSVILEPGLKETDFQELQEAGVWLAKAGFGAFSRPGEAAPLVRFAQKYGMKVMSHSGGASIPGSSSVRIEDLLEMNPDIAGHANGGTTSLSLAEMERLVHETEIALQVSQAGNLKAALTLIELCKDANNLERVILGSDTPSGTGVMPLGILKSIAEIASLADVPAEVAIAMATGNNAKAYGLSGGVIAAGRPADLIVMDAPLGSHQHTALQALSAGDLPGISLIVIDGTVEVLRSRNTPPAARSLEPLPMPKQVGRKRGNVPANGPQRVD